MRLRGGVWFDPNCPRCEFGWIDTTDATGRDQTRRCYDCQAASEALKARTP